MKTSGRSEKRKKCVLFKWQRSGNEEDRVIYWRQHTVVKQLVAEAKKGIQPEIVSRSVKNGDTP